MRRYSSFLPLLVAFASPFALAGGIDIRYFSELDGTFNPGLPGRVSVAFDQAGTAMTDLGVNAFSDSQGRITTVAQVDINNADANIVGIGLARHTYPGAPDATFQTGGKRVKDAALTAVVDACIDPNGRIVVAGMTAGANGSGGAKDLALVRFNADGSDDPTFAGDGGVAFTYGDGVGEVDEGIRDLDCLPNGNLLVAGWFEDQTGRNGFIAEMPANGDANAVRRYTLGASANSDAVMTSATAVGTNIVATGHIYGDTNMASMIFLSPNGNTYAPTPGLDLHSLGGGWPYCGNVSSPQLFGVVALSNTDYVFSGLRSNGSDNVPMLVRIQFGESVLISCTAVGNGIFNAYVTPPVALGDFIFVAGGLQPFGSGPITSRLNAFVVPANGGALVPAQGFGTNGMVQWSYPYDTANVNNNRSFVQRLYIDPGYGLMAVGSRTFNGSDTDAVLARFGASGVFSNGFENPVE